MGRVIEINCRKVYDSGKEYQNYCEEIIDIQKYLDEVSSNINEIWGGVDNDNFLVSFNNHVKDLDLIINFLGSNGQLLQNNALEHGNIDNSFATEMEKSGLEDDDEPKY
jgi:hypothetical protein